MDNAPDRIWFTKVMSNVIPNSERVTPDDVEYVRADLASPIGAVAMREAAAGAVQLVSDYIEEPFTVEQLDDLAFAIRRLPLPTDADLDRTALDRPKVRALVEAEREACAAVAELAPYKRGSMVCGCSEGLGNWTAAAIRARGAKP